MKPNREQTIIRLTELIFPDNMQGGAVNEQAHEIVTTILAYLNDPEITHLYYEGVSTVAQVRVSATCDTKRGNRLRRTTRGNDGASVG